jgi:hypothetical protein
LNNSLNTSSKKEKIKTEPNITTKPTIFEKNPLIELPTKLELDNKALKSIMPYFEKNMTYTKRLAKSRTDFWSWCWALNKEIEI